MQSGPLWEILPTKDARSLARSAHDAAHHQTKYKLPIQPRMVYRIPEAVERHILPSPPSLLPETTVTTNVAGSWGCGAWHVDKWFQLQWDRQAETVPIAAKQLIPTILACTAWGYRWQGRQVLCQCDNQVVVACLRSRTSKDKYIMHLLRCLVFVEATHKCFLHPTYINTKANHLADDLSRDNLSSFLSKVPNPDPQPTPISQPLLDLLLEPNADWISPHWSHQFSDIFRTG